MTERFPTYEAFAEALVQNGIVTDPWLDGAPRFRTEPLELTRAQLGELASAAEELGAAYHELVQRVRDAGDVALDDFFRLTPWQRAMFEMGGDLWHGLARADLFFTDSGVVTTELNCDTPTGEAEAWVLGQLFAHPGALDVNRGLRDAFLAMNAVFFEAFVEPGAPRTVGLVYPTEFVEDLALVRLYRQWFEAAGYQVVLGSPFNLRAGEDGEVTLFGERISLLWRHYKTDWWSERETAFDDEALADVAPLERELHLLDAAQRAKKLVVVNPLSSVLPQNKRAMAYFWENLHAFSHKTQASVRRLIPPTFRLEVRDHAALLAEKDQWVLKSDYGAEGDEVIVGKHVSAELFGASLAHARPGRWIVQRYFEAQPLSVAEPELVANYGVYLIGGAAAGVYARVHSHNAMTDEASLSVPVLARSAAAS